MANRLGIDIIGKRIKVAGRGDRIFKVNEGADAGFGSIMCCSGQAIFGKWEDNGQPARIEGCDVESVVEDCANSAT